jgi:predicted ferric reductase
MSGPSRGTWRGIATLAIVYAIPALLWLEARPIDGWSGNRSYALLSLGSLAGLVGASAFAANLILGARLPYLQRWFGGLENLYRLHRGNGRFAGTAVGGHVFLMALSRVDSGGSAFDLFRPSAGTTIFLGVVAFVLLAVALVLTLRVRLGHEVFVYVQRSFGVIFAIGALHFFRTAGVKAGSPLLTVFLLVLSVAALAAFLYRSVLGNLLVRRYGYVVSDARELDPTVMEITMEPTARAIRPIPGQFVYATFYSDEFEAQFHPVSLSQSSELATIVLRPGEVRDQFHPFSITSAPSDPNLRLVVKAVGTFTRALHRLKPGAVARIEGPYGEFSHTNMKSHHQVWVAGGIGITPFLSMARSLEGDGYDVRLLYGVKTRADAYFAPELEAIAERVGGFDVTVVAEDEEGFIGPERILRSATPNDSASNDSARQDSASDDLEVLICGPPAMVSSLREGLTKAGLPSGRIHGERFGFGPRA